MISDHKKGKTKKLGNNFNIMIYIMIYTHDLSG